METTGKGWCPYLDLEKRSGSVRCDDRSPTVRADLAFHSAFLLAPLLVIVITVASKGFAVDAAREAIVGQVAGLVGAIAAFASYWEPLFAAAPAQGAAGILGALLLWLCYAAQVFLPGAAFTQQIAAHRANCGGPTYVAPVGALR